MSLLELVVVGMMMPMMMMIEVVDDECGCGFLLFRHPQYDMQYMTVGGGEALVGWGVVVVVMNIMIIVVVVMMVRDLQQQDSVWAIRRLPMYVRGIIFEIKLAPSGLRVVPN